MADVVGVRTSQEEKGKATNQVSSEKKGAVGAS